MAPIAICAVVPLVAAVAGLLPMDVRAREGLTLLSACACAAAVGWLVAADGFPLRALGDTVHVDGLSAVLGVTVALVYLVASVFAIGYFGYERGHREYRVYNRRFHVLFNVFAASMFWVPFCGNLMVLWLAVEVTTVTSALLVGLERSQAAAEAAWKYILIASAGLVVALLGLTLLYFAATPALGTRFDPTFDALLAAAPRMTAGVTQVAFALIVVGFGTKAGLVPMHTWLPDAHSEGATPVSAMLSGALLADAMYAIFRVDPIVVRAVGGGFPHLVLYAFGIASLLVAAAFALRQVSLKRLYAYSSIEHMGILAVGVAIGGQVALYGVMLHIVAHGACKALAFFGAGSVLQRFGTRDGRAVRGLAAVMPATTVFVVVGLLAVSALPPGGLFRSELMIALGAFQHGAFAPAAVLILLVNLVFLGALRLVAGMTFTQPAPAATRGESSRVMLLAMAMATAGALVLGVWVPEPLDHVLREAARVVGGAA
jgi:hydrogenase-4 component F